MSIPEWHSLMISAMASAGRWRKVVGEFILENFNYGRIWVPPYVFWVMISKDKCRSEMLLVPGSRVNLS